MKKTLCILFVTMLSCLLLFGCNKENPEYEVINGYVIQEAVYGDWPNNKEMVVECEDGMRITCDSGYVPHSTMMSFKRGTAVTLTISYRYGNNSVSLKTIQRNVALTDFKIPPSVEKEIQSKSETVEGIIKQTGIYSRWWDNKREMVVERISDGLRIKVYSGDVSYDIMESFKVGDKVLITVKEWHGQNEINTKTIQTLEN